MSLPARSDLKAGAFDDIYSAADGSDALPETGFPGSERDPFQAHSPVAEDEAGGIRH